MMRKERSPSRSIDGNRKYKKTNRSISCESKETSKNAESDYSNINKRNQCTLAEKKNLYI